MPEKKILNVAIYARVSMADQNPEMQITALRQYTERRGFTIYREYVDHVTGNIDKRRREKSKKDVAYQSLMADARRRLFDAVIVWKFDRFARSLTGLIEALQTFSALGIDFISSTQDVDTTTAMGRLFFHVVAAFAEFEREMIVERINAGIANAKAKGIKLGRPIRPEVEKQVMEMYERGVGIRQISREVKRCASGVLLIIHRHKLAGRGNLPLVSKDR